jgi:2-keto-3-deoxy-L-rhamnonate aldolase RhmA
MTTSARTTIRRRILDGETLFGAWTDMASPLATEITGGDAMSVQAPKSVTAGDGDHRPRRV